MHITQTVNYGWRNISQSYSVTCKVCKKTLYRTVSDGCNQLADADYIKDIRAKLEVQAKKASKEEITCNACLKERIGGGVHFEPIPEDVITMANALLDCYNRDKKAIDAYLAGVTAAYEDRIIIVNEEEWVLRSIENDSWRGEITVYAARINKVNPWLTTANTDNFKLSEILITKQTLKERKEQVEYG